MRSISRGWVLLTTLCSMILAAGIMNAQAPFQEPIGTQGSFNASGTITTEFSSGLLLDTPYEGVGTFKTIGNESIAGLPSTQLVPVSLEGTGFNEQLGQVIWRADIERTISEGLISTITSNQGFEYLPATGRLEFYATLTLGNQGNGLYRSETPVVMSNPDITAWPYEEAMYRQDGGVMFVNTLNPTDRIRVVNLMAIVTAQPLPPSPCHDPCCHTDAISLNTGYNHAAGNIFPIGSLDTYWVITSDPDPFRPVPRPANVIARSGAWAPAQPNTQWIGATPSYEDPAIGTITYSKCFCLCRPSELTFSMSIFADDSASVFLNGSFIGSTPGNALQTVTNLIFTRPLPAGRHCLEVRVTNKFPTAAGVNVQGSINGPGLLKLTCCGPITPPSPCHTNHLQLVTNGSWTLVSGPPGTGAYPRCASVIPNPSTAWGLPVSGTNWIGPNPNGISGPPPQNTYIYRKCFCVQQAGTYTISITTMADDMVDIFLNGIFLFSHSGFQTPSTQTFQIGLGVGCNCLEFRVRDLGFAITGLDALVDIQGPLLLLENCCACSNCNTSLPPDNPNPPGNLSMKGDGDNNAEADNHTVIAAMNTMSHPMLMNIPDPATGENMVHYVMDQEATAEVGLFNKAGERMRTIDAGMRTSGQHSVQLDTEGLPAGSYSLQLVYAEHTLSVPVNVE